MVGVREDPGGPAELGARFGPYFALDRLPGGGPPPAGWAVVADLADPATGAFDRRVRAVRSALAAARSGPAETVDERVAVSVAQLGLCARLVAPALALTVVGRPLALDPRRLYWRDVLGGPFPLAFTDAPSPPAGDAPEPGGAERFAAGTLLPVVAPIVEAVGRGYPVSEKVLWGNVASAVAGAAKMIGLAEPAFAAAAWRVVDELCGGNGGPLLDTGGRVGPARFRRRSCCLIYRLAQGGARAVCEDCVLGAGPSSPGRAPR
ncbi:(2Fe-2S)-binding protein [Pseudofrankia inefficax]|uniref:Ferric iron reductase n=1 Tax=Pseudofrankia inefficax (strain DSM 45817 / CECT 9037 / DDB 130130 / EuI1c) TaxID=298654 RepID=E3J6X4_PSEI1|nr:ferric iron reductase [Pseudofrankia inefficax]